LVARALRAPFVDGDDLHSLANISKMKEGLPLTDDDRGSWLKRVRAEMSGRTGGWCGGLLRP